MSSINILGCCVLRDIFRVADTSGKYKINQFLQFNNPISAMQEIKNNKITPDMLHFFEDTANFLKKCVCNDINKTTKNLISSTTSDYFLMDLSELRFKLAKINFCNGESTLVTHTKFLETINENIKKYPELNILNIEYDVKLSDEYFSQTLEKYFDFIKGLYKEDKIIVVENYLQYRHLSDTENKFFEYYKFNIDKANFMLKTYYKQLSKAMPNANFIKMPDNCIGTTSHLWGKDPLHFTDEYYFYLFQCIEIIVKKEKNKAERIETLRNMYSAYFKLLEKQKRLEYYIQNKNEDMLCEPLIYNSFEGKDWKKSFSPKAGYDNKTNMLYCGDEDKSWAILTKEIKLEEYLGKTICFSVKYQTFNESTLFMVYRYKNIEDKWIYQGSKQVMCDDYENIDSLVIKIPEIMPEYKEAIFSVYLSAKNNSAKISGVKIELGEFSSLY